MIYGLFNYPKKDFQHIALIIFSVATIVLGFFSEPLLFMAFPAFLLMVAFCLVKAVPFLEFLLEQTQLDFQERTWSWTAAILIGCVILFGFMPGIKAYTPHPNMNDALFCAAEYMNFPETIPFIALPQIMPQLEYYSKQPTIDNEEIFTKALLTTNENISYNLIKESCTACKNKAQVVISSLSIVGCLL